MPDDLKRRCREHREVTHIRLYGLYGHAVVGGSRAVTGQLSFREIGDRNVRPQQGEGSRLLASTRGQEQDALAGEVAQPPMPVNARSRSFHIQIQPRPGEVGAGLGKRLPSPDVVCSNLVHLRAPVPPSSPTRHSGMIEDIVQKAQELRERRLARLC